MQPHPVRGATFPHCSIVKYPRIAGDVLSIFCADVPNFIRFKVSPKASICAHTLDACQKHVQALKINIHLHPEYPQP